MAKLVSPVFPELFASGLRIWQQPCAVVDSIIWRWQQELEAEEYSQAVRITDCLGAVWTKKSKESSFLLGQVDAPVPPGCTPLCQPTDTHLAKPAKELAELRKTESAICSDWLHFA